MLPTLGWQVSYPLSTYDHTVAIRRIYLLANIQAERRLLTTMLFVPYPANKQMVCFSRSPMLIRASRAILCLARFNVL